MKKKQFLAYLGSGLLYAGAAIGVSHLVQSTRAGALFGFQLLAIVLVVNVLKYPFFETGSRYSAATGNSLVHAYGQLDRRLLWFYLVQTFLTMFIIQSALLIVTTGILKTLIGLSAVSNWVIASFISVSCVLILFLGQYQSLKQFTKVIIIALTICTLLAAVFAAIHPVNTVENTRLFSFNHAKDIAFLVALLGWMPAPIDISVWQSVWRVDGNEDKDMRLSLLDFHVGYWGTVIISVAFLSLGAFIFFNSGETLATAGSDFSNQLVNMYATAIGSWAWPVVAFAAFAAMFSTCLTCLDASPRVIQRTVQELGLQQHKKQSVYIVLVMISATAAVLIPILSGSNMTALVDFATTVSFLTAPVFATLNFKLNYSDALTKDQQPGRLNYIISWCGIVFLYGFALYFLATKLGWVG